MLHDSLRHYIGEIEKALLDLGGIYVERYEEEILSPTRINLRLRIRFSSGATFEISEAVIVISESVTHLGYRYHFQDSESRIVFRYDNTPHYQNIETFPHHRHTQTNVTATEKPSIDEVIEEARRWKKQS